MEDKELPRASMMTPIKLTGPNYIYWGPEQDTQYIYVKPTDYDTNAFLRIPCVYRLNYLGFPINPDDYEPPIPPVPPPPSPCDDVGCFFTIDQDLVGIRAAYNGLYAPQGVRFYVTVDPFGITGGVGTYSIVIIYTGSVDEVKAIRGQFVDLIDPSLVITGEVSPHDHVAFNRSWSRRIVWRRDCYQRDEFGNPDFDMPITLTGGSQYVNIFYTVNYEPSGLQCARDLNYILDDGREAIVSDYPSKRQYEDGCVDSDYPCD